MNLKQLALIATTIAGSNTANHATLSVLTEKPATVCLWPIMAALDTADKTFLDPFISWTTTNELQKLFMDLYWTNKQQLSLFNDKEMSSKASKDVTEVNNFLTENHFDIQLEKEPSPSAFYVAAILDLTMSWRKKGQETIIHAFGQEFPAISFTNNSFAENFIVNDLPTGPVIELHTESPTHDILYLMPVTKRQQDFELLHTVELLHERLNWKNARKIHRYSEIIFPMVTINDYPNINWLTKLEKHIPGTPFSWEISQALQQTKFQMNEEGAAVQSAAAISGYLTMEAEDTTTTLIINQPFIVWIERPIPNSRIPDRIITFAAYCPPSCWVKPAKLGK